MKNNRIKMEKASTPQSSEDGEAIQQSFAEARLYPWLLLLAAGLGMGKGHSGPSDEKPPKAKGGHEIPNASKRFKVNSKAEKKKRIYH